MKPDLHAFDEAYYGRVRGSEEASGSWLCGIDEAGRGPIAGPVVAAAVILSPEDRIEGLRDSKVVPEAERRELFIEIVARARAVGVGIGGIEEIERHNILGATKRAMVQAVEDLGITPEFLLVDAVDLGPMLSIPQEALIKGDAKSAHIAAASIVAKYVRDSLMLHYHSLYPHYRFDRHKGYGTAEHLEMLGLHGPCPIHRPSFGSVKNLRLPF